MQLNKIKTTAMIQSEYDQKKKRNKSLQISDIDPTFAANIPLSIVHPLRIIFEWVHKKQKGLIESKTKRGEEEEDQDEED